ncbi:MAG: type II secretion system F family protein [Thermodesulfobacteriota bacterium]|nr:type II secretion system F family protein [Thermodesulfobacteriota bacterium]
MAVFTYKALTESGNKINGEIEAETEQAASQAISLKGYIPLGVKKKTGNAGSRIAEKLTAALTPVRPRDLILFTKQFKTMLAAGVPLIHILETLESQTENKRLQQATIKIQQDIKDGASLHETFSKHPGIFSNLYCSMLQAGERSGALVEVMKRLIYIIEHEAKVKSDIRSAMFYPAIVVTFLGVAFFVLLMFVIPKFVSIFERVGIDLPLPTKVCLALYSIIAATWPYILIGLLGGGVLLYYYVKTEQGKFVRDNFLLRIPIIGDLILKGVMSRFASIFSILQYSGVQVLESMDILAEVIGNTAVKRQFQKIRERIKEGRGISEPLQHASYFPPMVINMVAIGEESGNLEEMLSEISDHYDTEVEYATQQLADALGPFLTIMLAAVIGFFALAIFLPMWDLTKMV